LGLFADLLAYCRFFIIVADFTTLIDDELVTDEFFDIGDELILMEEGVKLVANLGEIGEDLLSEGFL